jgi:thiosulfate/3-mercaptopyruvate sulfurtransferase
MGSNPLISAAEVLPLMGRAVFLDARAGPDADHAYAAAHLSGAIHLDLESALATPRDPSVGGRHPLPATHVWLEQLASFGVRPGTPVIVYDSEGGGMAAARAWWMLRAIGHESVAVIDGGWQAVRDAGLPIESGITGGSRSNAYPSAIDRWPTVDADWVERVREDPTWRLIDARAPERYQGRSEPLDPVAGHIPGAHNLYWRSQLSSDGRFRSRAELRERYAEILDGVPAERVICYCGSGVTACHLLLAMEVCGLVGAHIYVGSWGEWCRQARPRAGG